MREAREQAFNVLRNYDADNVSLKVAGIILSCTDYVNRTVWYKS